MKHLRSYLAILLALTLVLTAHAAAAARGQGGAQQAVLCTGAGVVLVYLDQEGQPVGAPHLCPDCALHALDLASPVPGAVYLTQFGHPIAWPESRSVPVAKAQREGIRARAPPLFA